VKCNTQSFNESGWSAGAVDEQLPVDRQRGSYPQALPRSVIDLIGDGVQEFLAVDRQVRALGQVLSHQPVHVLVAATPPRAVSAASGGAMGEPATAA